MNKIDKDKIFIDNSVLVPAIIQDDKTLKVLMLGYMNRESFEYTEQKGLVTFTYEIYFDETDRTFSGERKLFVPDSLGF